MTLAHVAPLVGFALFLAFATILAFTGLIGRRWVEAALILAAIAFMISRMAAHWRLHRAQKASGVAIGQWRQAGEAKVRVDDAGVYLDSAAGSRQLAFADCSDVEYAGQILYLWPRRGEPICIPGTAFPDEKGAEEFLAYARARLPRLKRTAGR
jgi:hypothetical protein